LFLTPLAPLSRKRARGEARLPSPTLWERGWADKGTAVGYEISGAGAPFCPSPPLPPSLASGRGGKRGSPLPLCGRGAGLIRVQPSDTKSLEQARLFVPHPPCPPLSQAGEGGSAAPLSHSVGEGLGVRATKSAYPSSTVNPSDVLPIARAEFTIAPLLQVPPASRGEPSRAPVRFPLRAGGTFRRGLSGILVFVNFGCAIGIPLSDLQEQGY
jgi:hypothetical protein